MKREKLSGWLFLMIGAFCVSCSDDNDDLTGGGKEEAYAFHVADASEYNRWAYFDFESGKEELVQVTSETGAVEGLYYGQFGYAVMGQTGVQDSVKLTITRLSSDSVELSLTGVKLAMGGGDPQEIELTARAGAEKENGLWKITGSAGSLMNGETEYHDIVFNGTIGTTEGSATDLTVAFVPGRMPVSIQATYTGKTPANKIWKVENEPESWDIAFHKYDIRTNGGAAVKTDKYRLADVTEVPASGFESDVAGEVMVDMSQMMEGYVGYQSCMLNKVLGGWVDAKATGTMPPYTYTLNSNVFVLKTKAGKYVKIRFYDMTNETGKKVNPAFNYEVMNDEKTSGLK